MAIQGQSPCMQCRLLEQRKKAAPAGPFAITASPTATASPTSDCQNYHFCRFPIISVQGFFVVGTGKNDGYRSPW